jgi:hypothetical protein
MVVPATPRVFFARLEKSNQASGLEENTPAALDENTHQEFIVPLPQLFCCSLSRRRNSLFSAQRKSSP